MKFFFQSISWNIVLGAFHKTWNTFMKHFYLSISVSLRTFLINKKIVFTEKRYNLKFNSIKYYLLNFRWLANSGIIYEWILHHTIDHAFMHWFVIHLILLILTIMTLPPEQNLEAAAGDVLKKHLRWSFFLQSCKPSGLQCY